MLMLGVPGHVPNKILIKWCDLVHSECSEVRHNETIYSYSLREGLKPKKF